MPVVYFLAALLGAGLLYQALGRHSDRRRFPPLGRILDIGACRLHLHEQGAAEPVVVLESGIASTSLAWALVQPRIAEFARVLSYDRAGLGWSSTCRAPRTLEGMVSELAALLRAANIPPPYVLVGHSFGGLLIRAFAFLHPDEVAGLVFVDPVCVSCWANTTPHDLRRLSYGAKFSRRGAWLARFGVVRAALAMLAAGSRSLPKLIARASAPGAAGNLMTNLVGQVRKLPPELWPMIRCHWSDPKCFQSMAAHLASLPAAARAAIAMPVPASIPLVILSAENATPAEIAERQALVRENPMSRHLRVENTGHWIHLERPDAVIGAVRELASNFLRERLIDGARGRE